MTEFLWPVRVYYEDTDAGGVVYHSHYLNFMERARTEYLRKLGFEQDELAKEDVIFAVHRAEVDFIRPARFNDALEVVTSVIEQRRASLTFAQTIRKTGRKPGSQSGADGETCCQAKVRVACINQSTFRPQSIPQDIVKAFSNEQ